jgi:uncharacterized membrane protein
MKNQPRTEHQQQNGKSERFLVNGLGLFSIGLGLAEVIAPKQFAKLVGMDRQLGLIRAMGVRELSSGAGLLSQRASHQWAWSRVGGDLVDLALLGAAARTAKKTRPRLAITAAAIAGVTALDWYCSHRLRKNGHSGGHAAHFNTSITVDRPPENLYVAWRNFEDLPRFMDHLVKVEKTGPNVWHWIAKGPARSHVEWDAEIIEDVPNERIVWRSLEKADVRTAGTVRFERTPEGRGTRMTVNMLYQAPAGKLGAGIARLFGQSPEKQIAVDLHRFKEWMETGEIGTATRQPAARSARTSKIGAFLHN